VSNTRKPTTFAEMVGVVESMPVILLNFRRARGLSQRDAAEQLGLSFSTVSRIESGAEFSSVSLKAVLIWLEATS
jgi:transcriptional regulator with XRE-family HTH domain